MHRRLAFHFNRKRAFTTKTQISHSPTRRFKVEVCHSTHLKDATIRIPHSCNYLLAQYLERRTSDTARKLFDEMTQRDVRTWTILLSGLLRCGNHMLALDYFRAMMKEGMVTPNAFTLSSLLKCCASLESGCQLGRAIHCWIIRNGVDVDVALENALLDLYAKCRTFHYLKRLFERMEDKDSISWNIMMAAEISRGAVEETLHLFLRLPVKTVSSWNTMLDGLLQHGFESNALELLCDMVKVRTSFDHVTFSVAFILSSSLKSLELGRQIHCHLLRTGIHEDSFVQTSLIDMYCKCREMGKASLIFREVQNGLFLRANHYLTTEALYRIRSVMISGYVQNGMINEALVIFKCMIHEQVEIDLFTVTSIVTASSQATLLELGQQVHAHTIKLGDIQDIMLCASIIDMYAKCGNLDNAWLFFCETQSSNIVLWSAMISGYAVHGCGIEAVQLFELITSKGITPNEVTFLGLLTACSRAGLVEEGCVYFRMMTDIYRIQPGIEHYVCMIDLFGRAGHLKETENFVYANGIHPLKEIWKAFLSTCCLHKNVQMTNWISEKILELEGHAMDPNHGLLISNTYSASQLWEEAAKVRDQTLKRGAVKLPGQSWIYSQNT